LLLPTFQPQNESTDQEKLDALLCFSQVLNLPPFILVLLPECAGVKVKIATQHLPPNAYTARFNIPSNLPCDFVAPTETSVAQFFQ
jgi:hypothetical protein